MQDDKHTIPPPLPLPVVVYTILTQVLKPGYFEQTLSERTMWGRVPYRAHVRALYGVANTLRKMGR